MPVIALTLQPAMDSLPAWGVYLVTWAFIFVESGLLVGFLLPGDSVIFAAGLIAGTPGSSVNIIVLLVGSFLAAFVGDQVGYVLGRKLGRPWVESRKRPMWSSGLTRAEAFYERLGYLSVIVARFIPWVRTFIPIIAGTAAMALTTFAMGGLGVWMPTFLVRLRGLDVGQAGVLFGGVTAGAGLPLTLRAAIAVWILLSFGVIGGLAEGRRWAGFAEPARLLAFGLLAAAALSPLH